MNDASRSPSLLRVFGQPKMAALFFLGFSSGLPLFLTSRTLQAWMTVEGVDLATVGKVSLLALPYSLKFLWAPLMDRYVPPFLGRRGDHAAGRRGLAHRHLRRAGGIVLGAGPIAAVSHRDTEARR